MKKWTYTSIVKKLMTLHSNWGNASKCSVGWTGYHNVQIDDWVLERREGTNCSDFTWYVNNEPVLLKRDHHHKLDALIWRMDKWD